MQHPSCSWHIHRASVDSLNGETNRAVVTCDCRHRHGRVEETFFENSTGRTLTRSLLSNFNVVQRASRVIITPPFFTFGQPNSQLEIFPLDATRRDERGMKPAVSLRGIHPLIRAWPTADIVDGVILSVASRCPHLRRSSGAVARSLRQGILCARSFKPEESFFSFCENFACNFRFVCSLRSDSSSAYNQEIYNNTFRKVLGQGGSLVSESQKCIVPILYYIRYNSNCSEKRH